MTTTGPRSQLDEATRPLSTVVLPSLKPASRPHAIYAGYQQPLATTVISMETPLAVTSRWGP